MFKMDIWFAADKKIPEYSLKLVAWMQSSKILTFVVVFNTNLSTTLQTGYVGFQKICKPLPQKVCFSKNPYHSGNSKTDSHNYFFFIFGFYRITPLPPRKFQSFLWGSNVFFVSFSKGVPCDLVTGEERQWAISPDQPASHVACTVEMCSTMTSCM